MCVYTCNLCLCVCVCVCVHIYIHINRIYIYKKIIIFVCTKHMCVCVHICMCNRRLWSISNRLHTQVEYVSVKYTEHTMNPNCNDWDKYVWVCGCGCVRACVFAIIIWHSPVRGIAWLARANRARSVPGNRRCSMNHQIRPAVHEAILDFLRCTQKHRPILRLAPVPSPPWRRLHTHTHTQT